MALIPPAGVQESELHAWADLLSSAEFDRLFQERSGTATVSVRLLLKLAYPVDLVPTAKASGRKRASNY